jgi:hypothetical protein
MENILSNKKEIIKIFEETFKELESFAEITPVNLVTKRIKEKVMLIAAEIFKDWFYKKIGNGYSGTTIEKNINDEIVELKFNNYNEKNYVCCLGNIKLKRAYYLGDGYCCYPSEEKAIWLKDEFMPDVKEMACLVSMIEPYQLASDILYKVGNISISASSLQKITKKIGNELVIREDKDAADYTVSNREQEKNVDLMVISTDGCCINTQDGWKEVKNGAVYQVSRKSDNKLHAYNKSYISRIENSDDFGKRLYMEARRRNIHLAKKIVVIGDGAKWIWNLSKKHFSFCTEIVDWYHATEHLWKIVEYLYGNRENKSGSDFEEGCEDLLYSGFIALLEDKIMKKIDELNIRIKSSRYNEIIRELNYFKTNENRMKYKDFEKLNYPIGSGVIEGECKHLVQLRMKRSGMKWSLSGAHDVLQLRCLYFSNRWHEVENLIMEKAG